MSVINNRAEHLVNRTGFCSVRYTLIQSLYDPTVQTETAFCRWVRNTLMQVRPKADIQLAWIRLPRLDLIFPAGLKAFVNETAKLAPNPIDISGFESCDWIGTATSDPSVKTTDRIIELHFSCVAFVFHHGLTSVVHRESPIYTKFVLNGSKILYRVWQKIPQLWWASRNYLPTTQRILFKTTAGQPIWQILFHMNFVFTATTVVGT